jgi:hypothetical protein
MLAVVTWTFVIFALESNPLASSFLTFSNKIAFGTCNQP